MAEAGEAGTGSREAVRVVIRGGVQGVGYRFWTRSQAEARGLGGWVRNRADGRVEALFSGEPAAVATMLEACRQGPAGARVEAVEIEERLAPCAPPFRIRQD